MIVIHNFARGVRGLRLVWQCEEMGLPYRLQTVDYPPNDAYLALNPLRTLPFVEDEGGVALGESVAVMLYLAERYGPTPLLPKDDARTLARVLQLLVLSEATLGAQLNILMAAHFGAPDADKRNWSVLATEARVEQALAFVTDMLGERAYLAGDELTLADIAISTGLGVWRGALGKELGAELVAYRARLAERPAYQRALESRNTRRAL